MLLRGILGIIVLLFLWRFGTLARNYVVARRIGLPIVIVPFSWQDPLWMIVSSKFSFLKYLPLNLGRWYLYSTMGWNLNDRYTTHARLGGAYTIVTPKRNDIIVCDPANIHEAMGKHKKWLRPRELYSLFEVFGDNVDTVNGEEWQKHRKVINHGFAEKNMGLVWQTAKKQAAQWLKQLEGKQSKSVAELTKDCDHISANVLMHAAFGQEYEFGDGFQEIRPGHKKSFGEVVRFMLQNVIFVWMTNKLELPSFLEPRPLKQLRSMKDEMLLYFEETLQRRDGELTKALVEANENEKTNGRNYLTTQELFGNMFIVQIAGLDTTSYAMLFSIALLAANPSVQEWARQDIGSYVDTFERSVRIQAIMFETLRVYGAAPAMARISPETQTMLINGKERVIPPNTYMSSNMSGASHDPHIWGDDVDVWNPQRWITTTDGVEHLKKDPELTAWSVGPRVCPGKKFSQVEFTAAIGTMLEEFRLEGSSGLQKTIDDFEFNITPKMKKPESASINFIRR